MSVKQIIRMERSKTSISNSPMWKCLTLTNERVNIFQHDDPNKDSFLLFAEAGYSKELSEMKLGDVLNWSAHPITIEMYLNGKWWEIATVLDRPEGAMPDTPLTPKTEAYKKSEQEWAYFICNSTYKIVLIDTETTGLTENDEIIEIAVVNLDGKPLLNQLIKPSKPVPPEVEALTGITNEMLKDAPTFAEVYKQIEAVLESAIWLIYNAPFDTAMLDRAWMRHQLTPVQPLAVACVMEHFARWNGDWNGGHFMPKKLSVACESVGIKPPDHRALEDVLATAALVRRMTEE